MDDLDKDSEEDELAAAEAAMKLNKCWLFGVFVLATLLPGTVMTVRGLMFHHDCEVQLGVCEENCTKTHAYPGRIFQSEFVNERQCKQRCQAKADSCAERATGVIISAVLLGVGLVFAMCVYLTFEGVTKKFVRTTSDVDKKPRACYHEPKDTEEEQRKAQAKSWWASYNRPPAQPLTEAYCLDCEISVEVELDGEPASGAACTALCARDAETSSWGCFDSDMHTCV
eukprot:CAMPEP_0175376310 /NCGR_PEP_ID=MMETSP0095-20121207/24211_1 /TAXON_ID=311494 /ORGANISM="Alexandrium monilatum, Strain CCMP3105" /LENGTH=226 /DNA_ID=CAMNT_0016674593 /DNA_START=27 /DNA_END=705 /DNA_ORIENTATION=-